MIRSVAFGAITAAISLAHARPVGVPVVKEAPHVVNPHAEVTSRIIFLHRCPQPQGCIVYPGQDDSRMDKSALASTQVSLSGFSQSDEVWQRFKQCVTDTFAPFDVTITDIDPGPNVPHFENFVGGRATQLDPSLTNAIGVAVKTCDEIPNAVTFTFDAVGPDPDTLCWTASQEIAHAFGLEHEYNANDPLTYLGSGPSQKRFQAEDSPCGTYSPISCTCGRGATQNSYEYLLAMFGQGAVVPPTVSIKFPRPGKVLTPGFRLIANAQDDVGIERVELWVDGINTGVTSEDPPYLLTAPLDISEGEHEITVFAYDVTGAYATAIQTVTIIPPCGDGVSCPSGDGCVMGVCVPSIGTPGGLGTRCTQDNECLSNFCQEAEGDGQCSEPCEPDAANACPSDFTCLPAGDSGVCWYEGAGGCCDTRTGVPTGALMFGVPLAIFVLRRRRRS